MLSKWSRPRKLNMEREAANLVALPLLRRQIARAVRADDDVRHGQFPSKGLKAGMHCSDLFYNLLKVDGSVRYDAGIQSAVRLRLLSKYGFLRKSYFAYISFLLLVNVGEMPFQRRSNACFAVR